MLKYIFIPLCFFFLSWLPDVVLNYIYSSLSRILCHLVNESIFTSPSSNPCTIYPSDISHFVQTFFSFIYYFCPFSFLAHILFSCPRVCWAVGVLLFLEKTGFLCVGPGSATRSLTPGLVWLSELKTGLRNGLVKALLPTWRTSSGHKHKK